MDEWFIAIKETGRSRGAAYHCPRHRRHQNRESLCLDPAHSAAGNLRFLQHVPPASVRRHESGEAFEELNWYK